MSTTEPWRNHFLGRAKVAELLEQHGYALRLYSSAALITYPRKMVYRVSPLQIHGTKFWLRGALAPSLRTQTRASWRQLVHYLCRNSSNKCARPDSCGGSFSTFQVEPSTLPYVHGMYNIGSGTCTTLYRASISSSRQYTLLLVSNTTTVHLPCTVLGYTGRLVIQ